MSELRLFLCGGSILFLFFRILAFLSLKMISSEIPKGDLNEVLKEVLKAAPYEVYRKVLIVYNPFFFLLFAFFSFEWDS